MTPEVSCEIARRWLSRSIDEEISSREESLLEKHLDSCPHCREERERLFSEMDWIEENWAGVSDEIDAILRDRIGDDGSGIAVPVTAPNPASGPRLARTRVLAWAAVATLVAGGLLQWLAGDPSAPSRVAVVEHDAAGLTVERNGRVVRHDGAGRIELGESARFIVPEGGDAYLSLEGGSFARVGGGGALRFARLDRGTTLELTTGRATFQVEPKERANDGAATGSAARSDHPFVVRTPLAEIRVVGTLFGVVHEEGRTRVNVEEGIVQVRRRGSEEAPIAIGAGGWILVTRDRVQYPPTRSAADADADATSADPAATGASTDGPAGRASSEAGAGASEESAEGAPDVGSDGARGGRAYDLPSGGSTGGSGSSRDDR